MLKYKVSGKYILAELKRRGYSTYVLQRGDKRTGQRYMGCSAYNKLLNNEMVGITTLSSICDLLNCQLSDIVVAVDPDTDRMYKFRPMVDIDKE